MSRCWHSSTSYFGLFKLVFHEFQHAGFVEILDRENRLEHAFDAFAILGLDASPEFKNKSYEDFCTSIRFGISKTSRILP
jgi:hypothetical protein